MFAISVSLKKERDKDRIHDSGGGVGRQKETVAEVDRGERGQIQRWTE